MTVKSAGLSPTFTAGQNAPLQVATGTFTGDSSGTPITVNVGFAPLFAMLFDATNTKWYTWVQGMAATDSFYLVTGADLSVDTNSAFVSNWTTASQTEPGDYAVNASGSGVPTLINTSVTVPYQDRTKSYTVQIGINVNSAAYTWVMFG